METTMEGRDYSLWQTICPNLIHHRIDPELARRAYRDVEIQTARARETVTIRNVEALDALVPLNPRAVDVVLFNHQADALVAMCMALGVPSKIVPTPSRDPVDWKKLGF
jgi:hypothetical protein